MKIFKKFTEESFKGVHLDVVRELGRQIGVKAPTMKKKKQIIEEILLIQAGKLEPVEKNNRGAHVKIAIDVSPFMLEIREEDVVYGKTTYEPPVFSDVGPSEFTVGGILEICNGYGFIRVKNFCPSSGDAYVSQEFIKEYSMRQGDYIYGQAKVVKEGASAALQSVEAINGRLPKEYKNRRNFDSLTSCYPDDRITLAIKSLSRDTSLRMIDLVAPIGKGQRGLIVAPPKTGKTTLLKNLAKTIEKSIGCANLFVLLIDERPEEVTDMKRSVDAEVVYSTFDKSAEHHVKVAELLVSRAKRMVEDGEDVVILLDSITRLARAYNSVIESSGKTLSGGIDSNALQGAKTIFGSARNFEEGGSLTIIATALTETGSRMDDVIYEEFKGTGNMEIHLSRNLSEKRIFPAIDIFASGTRKEELLLSNEELSTVCKLRKVLSNGQNATEKLLDVIEKTENNIDLTNKIDEWLKIYGE